jgi:tRNA threonylcarbamoyl adenosine modification protein YeaZ
VLLAIDTSAGTSVAVVDREGGVIAHRAIDDTMRHAEVVGRLIEECLTEADTRPHGLSGVVGGMGPGPFTGLRVGIAAARIFALGAGIPFLPIISHDAIAHGSYRAGHTGGLVVVTDARRREVYWSAYSGADAAGLPVRIGGPGVARPDVLLEPDWTHAPLARLDAASVSAGDLGQVARLLLLNRRPLAADEALYLRSPDVTLSAGPKRVS